MAHNQNFLQDVRESTFKLTLFFIYVSTWLAVLVGMTLSRPESKPALWLGLFVMVFCGVAWWISHVRFSLAPYFLLLGLWGCTAFSAKSFNYQAIPYFFSIVVILAGNLTNLPFQFAIALISSAFILSPSDNRYGEIPGPVLILWLNLVASTIMTRGLIQALNISFHYQRYAVAQMDKARDQRGEMAKMAQALLSTQESLRRLNTQLRYARDSAEEARRLKAQFAANVSHELRTPINLIVGFSEMMAMAPEAYGVELPSVYRADIQAIYRNAKHLQNLINDILDISQIEAAKLAIVKEETDPRQVIEEAAQIARGLIESKKLAFHLYLPDRLPVMRIDRTRIRQVVLNMLANAVRFTDRGSITLETRIDDKHLIVSVIDTGIGIPQHELGRVFEEFYQIEGNLSRKTGGTGLGLTLSKQFINQHGGSMWIESEGTPGKGSTCSFKLPFTDVSLYLPRPFQPLAQPAEQSRQVIVWDEDPAIVQLFKGYTHEHQVNGSSSEGAVRSWIANMQPVAVVVSSHVDTTDLENCIVQTSPETAVIKCPMPSGRRAARAFGLADYLVKPISREALLNTLNNISLSLKHVLIVDDERDILRMLSRFLQTARQKYVISTASSGGSGLEVMRRERPDVVILDILMPDFDGFTVVQHMKADPGLKDIPVIAVSARGATEAITQVVNGDIVIRRQVGFQPIELVNCIEALAGELIPPSQPRV
jgi:signal transduction histidine kinase/CheY-like chemotaxis protein